MEIIWTLIIGGVAGWLAGIIMRGKGFGVLVDIIVGIIGGWLGGWLLGKLGFQTGGGMTATLIVALTGSVVLIALLRLLRRG